MNPERRMTEQVMASRGYANVESHSCARTWYCLCTLVFAPIAVAVLGCRDKGEVGSAPPQAVEVRYPPVEVQKVRIEKYSGIFTQREPIQNIDSVLKQMIEDVPLQYIQAHAEALAKERDASKMPNIAILLERIRDLRNKDQEEASLFVKKATEDRSADSLCVALFGLRTERSQQEVANSLSELKDPKAVRALTIRLDQASTTISGGTGATVLRNKLRQALVNALSECTGLDFSDYDPASVPETLAVVSQCQQWLEKHQ